MIKMADKDSDVDFVSRLSCANEEEFNEMLIDLEVNIVTAMVYDPIGAVKMMSVIDRLRKVGTRGYEKLRAEAEGRTGPR